MEFLPRRIVDFAKIVVQAAVVTVPFARGRGRDVRFPQHGFETLRASSGVRIARNEQHEERGDAFVRLVLLLRGEGVESQKRRNQHGDLTFVP